LEDREWGDWIFRMNMFVLIRRKNPFDPYKWKTLEKLRIKLAWTYYRTVAWFTKEVVF